MNNRIMKLLPFVAAATICVCNAQLPNDKGLVPGTSASVMYTNTDGSGFWGPNMHRLGWHWNLHKIQCPMAWHITDACSIELQDAFDPSKY